MLKQLCHRAIDELYRHQKMYTALIFLFAVGLAVGLTAPELLSSVEAEQSRSYLSVFAAQMSGSSVDFGSEMLTALFNRAAPILLIAVAGLHLCGLPVVVVTLLYQAFCMGYTISFLLDFALGSGLAALLLVLLPQIIIMLPLLLVASVHAATFAVATFRGGQFHLMLPQYAQQSALLLLVAVLLSFLQAALAPWLLKLIYSF